MVTNKTRKRSKIKEFENKINRGNVTERRTGRLNKIISIRSLFHLSPMHTHTHMHIYHFLCLQNIYINPTGQASQTTTW